MDKVKINEYKNKIKNTLHGEGFIGLIKKTFRFIKYKIQGINRKYDYAYKDILFINGCSLPHPQRYRVTHQIEQLESYGISCDKIDYDKLNMNYLRYYRGFVFYRCPVLPIIEEFIKEAKKNNKTCFYDIDDLVFDTKYTNQIKYLDNMNKDERNLYDDGVIRMGKTLDLCEYGIASTKRLQIEMSKHLKEVYINRNVASDEMVKFSKKALLETKKDDSKIIIGYLSGSITHNDDFKLVMKPIIKILKEYNNVYLKLVGLLDLPDEMKDVKDKIITSPFVDYRELPSLIRSVDINIAPLEDNIFNEAKSENKWMEASLVKIPTIASNVGAFKDSIINNKTGLLCSNEEEWYNSLKLLIENKNFRDEIANNSYNEVMKNHITIYTGKGIADFIKSKLRPNIAFVLPSSNISGGIIVATKHAMILRKNGYDVTMINVDKPSRKTTKIYEENDFINVVSTYRTEFLQTIDKLVATMWVTVKFTREYVNAKRRMYLVQNFETKFYKEGKYERKVANATYNNIFNIEYLTISKWCQNWLKDDFGVKSKYAPNGISLDLFKETKRDFNGKIRILIEGNSEDYYKNVDESFKITNKLDKNKFEIYYLSYQGEPKSWYLVDKFMHKVPHDKVSEIYNSADILLKSSILESFSYPPLEMMATGGITVVCPNDGNIEYLIDRENCLLYKQGDIDDAINKINEIVNNKELRNKLINGGLQTAKSRDWNNIESEIIDLYE